MTLFERVDGRLAYGNLNPPSLHARHEFDIKENTI